MAVNITFKNAPITLPFGMTMVPVASQYKEHYHLFAQNERYTNRTEIGSIKRGLGGGFLVTVQHRTFEVCGWKIHHEVQQTDKETLLEAATALYLHRINLIEQGVINEEAYK